MSSDSNSIISVYSADLENGASKLLPNHTTELGMMSNNVNINTSNYCFRLLMVSLFFYFNKIPDKKTKLVMHAIGCR